MMKTFFSFIPSSRSWPLLAIGLMVFVSPRMSSAAEGVLEINQICATSTGCFVGDSPGFPVTLSRSGPYRLTGNLVLPDENTTGLLITTSHVGIDLGGFRIEGPGIAGTGNGIEQNNGREDARIRNGWIVGVGDQGIRLEPFSRVSDVTVEGSGGRGISLDHSSVVQGCIVLRSGDDGISVGAGSRVIGNIVEDAGEDGIRDSFVGMILNNSVRNSTSFGLRSSNAIIDGNSFTENNGGFAAPQTFGSTLITISGNICGLDTTCP